MQIIADISWIEAHRRAASMSARPTPDAVRAVLRTDWDIWPLPGRAGPSGIARLPHLAIRHGIDLTAVGMRPVLAPDMDAATLEAGFWRQLRILPFPRDESVAMSADESAADPFIPDPAHAKDGGRAWFLRRILGHDVRDAILYLIDVRERDRTLFTLLLAKDFKAAFVHCPGLLDDSWPKAARARWRITRTRDRLPPVLLLVLLAELARAGCNHYGLLALSFDDQGREIYNRPFLEELKKLDSSHSAAPWAATLVDMAPLQTTALMPPDFVEEEREADTGRAWSEAAAVALTAGIAIYGQPLLDAVTRPKDARASAMLQAAVAHHPRFRPEVRAGRGSSLQKGQPASYWTLNWRLHGVVAIIDLAQQARAWSAQYRTGRDSLRPWFDDKPDRPIERAIVAISYCWIETYCPKALATALAPVAEAKRTYHARKAAEFGRDVMLDAAMDLSLDVLADGANFGSTICVEARARLAQLPGPGEEGYSARYRAHLWLDAKGDDIGFYERHMRKAIKRHQALLRNGTALDQSMRSRFHHDHRNLLAVPSPFRGARTLPAMRSDPLAARASQDYAMIISPPATDPMRFVNLQPWRWRASAE